MKHRKPIPPSGASCGSWCLIYPELRLLWIRENRPGARIESAPRKASRQTPNLNKSSAAVWVISSTGCSEEGPIHIEWNSEWPDGVTNGIAHLFCGGRNIDALPISLRPTVYACGLLLFLVFDDRNTQFIYFSISSWQFGGRGESLR